jgi:riboflavin synthase
LLRNSGLNSRNPSRRIAEHSFGLRQQSTFYKRVAIPIPKQHLSGRQQHGGAGVRALFTGIVEEMGTVKEVKQVQNGDEIGFEVTIAGSVVLEGVKLGDSIAVNGTCLTVIRFDKESFSVGLAPETLRRTSLGEAEVGALVNLERSLQPTSRMGGHFVQGHVDGTGTIASFDPEGDSLWVKVQTTPELLRYIVPKGYISVDGTSLTVVSVLDDESAFTFMLVGYTQQKIVVPLKKVGNKVNLEVDIVGKYVERLLQGYKVPSAT